MATLFEANRHDEIVAVWTKLRRLLDEYGYELRADVYGNEVDIDVHDPRHYDGPLFTLESIERAP